MAQITNYARPTRLYRFRSVGNQEELEQEVGSLESKYVWCGKFSDLNDPMEGVHSPSKFLARRSSFPKTEKRIEKKIASIGIASFCETHWDETMWAYYADNFKGICVAYSVRKLLKELPDEVDLAKMNYSDVPPLLIANSEDSLLRAKQALSYKSLRWSGEREWRLLSDIQGQVHYSQTSCAISVYLGPRMEGLLREKVTERVKKLGLQVYQMQVVKYSLEFHRVE